MKKSNIKAPHFWNNFIARKDLKMFKNNALLLYAFDLKFDIEDINSFASENLVDGSDDKKCDIIYLDYESKTAVIAQSYHSSTLKKEAKASKASDLNTAVTWLLSKEVNKVPTTIRELASELRKAIKEGAIETIEFWYQHNCHESENVRNELSGVEHTASNALKVFFKENTSIVVRAIEVGIETIEAWFKSSKASILVSNEFVVEIPGGYVIDGEAWEAFSTSVPLKWLYDLSKKYKKTLFSANVRDYLGSRKSDLNINNGIKETAENEPEMFWVYNNGITAIVNSFEPISNQERNKFIKLRINGISIVNGAQTTGAIGSLQMYPKIDGLVAARFIKSNPTTVRNIIRYNNSQNKISPSDFRSTDQYQEKLRIEFSKYPGSISYTGGRRGGDEDKIKRPQNYIPFEKVTQSLAAFHQMPGLAYNKKTEIWESDSLYSKLFNPDITSEHIIFVYSLFKRITDYKLELMNKQKNGELISDETKNINFLRRKASQYILIAGISSSLEIITNKPVSNKMHYKFLKKPVLSKAVNIWTPILKISLSFNQVFDKSLDSILQNNDQIQKDVEAFQSFISATKQVMQKPFSEFSSFVSGE